MRLLTFNCHEAWVHQLGTLDAELDIVLVEGRYIEGWDERMRPLPAGGRRVSLQQVMAEQPDYDCLIAHNISDLLACKMLPGPRLVVLHTTLEGRAANERNELVADQARVLLRQYLDMIGGHAVAISSLKGRSWGMAEDIVPCGVAVADYPSHAGNEAAALRISNEISKRRQILMWDFHEAAFGDLPVRLVGHNPDLPGVTAAADWDDLKDILSRHRFYIHTADPGLEDGYNMATLEAMAAGLPVLGNRHPTSPIEHGVSGFLSDDPRELHEYARRLLADAALARRMGEAARDMVRERFSLDLFAQRFSRSIELARQKWLSRQAGRNE